MTTSLDDIPEARHEMNTNKADSLVSWLNSMYALFPCDWFRCLPLALLPIILLVFSLTSCSSSPDQPEQETSESPSAYATPSAKPLLQTPASHTSDHLTIRIEPEWQMGQQNQVVVETTGISEPLILSVEIQPRFKVEPAYQKPVAIGGTPVAGNLDEVSGFQLVQRIGEGSNQATFSLPEVAVNPRLPPETSPPSGWLMKVRLARRLVAYPVGSPKQLGEVFTVLPDMLPESPTLIASEPTQRDLGGSAEGYELLIVPHSNSGMFAYFPVDDVVEARCFESGRSFDFREMDVCPSP